jgi:hypothetical protein
MAKRDTRCIPSHSGHTWRYDKRTHHYRCEYCRQWRKPQPDKIMAATWRPPAAPATGTANAKGEGKHGSD